MSKFINDSIDDYSEQQLRLEIERLLQDITILQQENHDLQIALLTTAEHGDTIEELLEETNKKLRHEIEQRKKAEIKLQHLLELVSQQRDDLELLINILTEHGDIIDNQWLEKISEINQSVMKDYLTKICNRGGFDFNLHKQWKIHEKTGNYLTILFFDIDYFKQYNDFYGHPKGDDCIKSVANIINEEFTPINGIVCRYGGEEFAVILPNKNLENAVKTARKTQEKLAEFRIEHSRSLVSSYITISGGITSVIPSSNIQPEEFIDYADKLMYIAKSQGRNQIVAQIMN
ncbi:GGDEF domain-containing protein [Geminocystis sp. GBBB08]|uniref:GGDEF domain-containing protein n=1 Tax=Geminocystis sp. GBBB08 TaxID=2604140 RepID=UPI0027E2C3EE|nr:GGDEF domain-containing protein [Geminocystis sp. GBBB08]